MSAEIEVYRPKNSVRVITATSLFDGHDVSTNIMRRILQDSGVEVVHLAHNRSVQELVDAAIEEDVQGIAMSSYQGGHMEAFKYMIDLLLERGASHIKVFGGGGGVIVPDEIRELERYGVTKIYSPEDGASMGLQGMINHMIHCLDFSTLPFHDLLSENLHCSKEKEVAGFITAVQQAKAGKEGNFQELLARLAPLADKHHPPVIGITGTGGAGKSSLTDEIILRFLHDIEDIKIAIICCDPSRRKTGGALLGDRIRMNSIGTSPRVFMRSLATRDSASEVSEALPEILQVVKAAGFDLIIAETAGIGQGDSKITELSDISLYVMTSEFGAPSQLEKIDMLDYADIIVVNKFDKRGSEDAVRDIRKQVKRNRKLWETAPEDFPVYGTIASKFNDDGVTALYHGILEQLAAKTGLKLQSSLPRPALKTSSSKSIVIPSERVRYLSEIAEAIRNYHQTTGEQAKAVRDKWHLLASAELLKKSGGTETESLAAALIQQADQLTPAPEKETEDMVLAWKGIQKAYAGDEFVYTVRGRELRIPLYTESLSHTKIPKISLPKFQDPGDIY
ncbi:MAG: cobalamin-dependent protein, partial [Desulfoprunum sp.]|nr:cobalamin-dependent protein [Desulfoprunum sp.]